MSCKNILVAYNGTKGAEAALSLGCLMAQNYDAHLTGILTHALPASLFTSYSAPIPQSAMDQLEDADREHRAKIRKNFEAATANLLAEKTHYMDVFGEADEKLMEAARTFDVVLMGNVDKDNGFPHMEIHPDVITRNSGRPVLVVPDDFKAEKLSTKVLLAWDGRRAAARAMLDAMPYLEDNTEVTVLTVGKDPDFKTRLRPILQHLERHNIRAKALQKPKGKGGIAATILDAVDETGAGFLVMGAYEHSKLAEDLFGGVTNTILQKTDVPVFMSH